MAPPDIKSGADHLNLRVEIHPSHGPELGYQGPVSTDASQSSGQSAMSSRGMDLELAPRGGVVLAVARNVRNTSHPIASILDTAGTCNTDNRSSNPLSWTEAKRTCPIAREYSLDTSTTRTVVPKSIRACPSASPYPLLSDGCRRSELSQLPENILSMPRPHERCAACLVTSYSGPNARPRRA